MIRINAIGHRFGMTWALRSVTAAASAGEVVGLLGPNGCGKTTLLKILATRLKPTMGDGAILGFHLINDLQSIRLQTEWLGHDLGLYKTLSGVENLEFASKIKGREISGEKMSAALDRVGLNGNRNKPVGSFSTGQKKRLALARILLEQPKFILLDEPHTNLDKQGKELMNLLIAEWKREGKTIWMASHDHKEILPLCDKALVLNEGRAVYFGEAKTIPTNTQI